MTTTIAKFTPIWNSPFNLGSFAEETIVSIQIETSNQSHTFVPINTTELDCTKFAGGITSASINEKPTTFTIAGTTVVFPVTTSRSNVTIISSLSNNVSLLCGNLPPGLSLSSTGLLSGTLGAIIPLVISNFEFTLRATNASGNVSDMSVIFTGTSSAYPETFNMYSLPSPVVDPFLNISYIPLGTYQPSQSVAYSIDISTHDGAPTALVLDNLFFILANDNKEYAGPPAGIMLSDTEIVGQVDPTAPVGLYLFKILIAGTKQSLVFGIEVVPYAGTIYEPPEALKWITDANLGSIEEGVSCYLSVMASSTKSQVNYSVVESLSNFPPGLSFGTSGELTGALDYGLANASFSFTIRAIAGTTFADREFIVTAISKYNAPSVYDISFVLGHQQSNSLLAPYLSLIPTLSLFRADDRNFGMAAPLIYLFNGIDGSVDLTTVLSPEVRPAITNNSYFSPIQFLLGEHVGTTVYNSFGIAVYDVVYRKLYEFESASGGFTTGDTPVASPVLYPQSRVSGGIYVYPICTRNMRCKLLTKFGCATNSNSKTFGSAGGETPPLWMGGEYVLALPIAYVLPGNGSEIAASLNASTSVTPNGTLYTFDRLYCKGGVTEYLHF